MPVDSRSGSGADGPVLAAVDARGEAAAAARTAVDTAVVGSLVTYPAGWAGPPAVRLVEARGLPGGDVLVLVGAGSVSAQLVSTRPLVTVRVAPDCCEPTTVQGHATRAPSCDRPGAVAYRVAVVGVRVGPGPSHLVSRDEFAAAEPDPLRGCAPAVLRHLNAHRADDLSACLRAQGHDAAFAEALRLDRRGLRVLAVGQGGVDEVRLDFPQPVDGLAELGPGLRPLLVCDERCLR